MLVVGGELGLHTGGAQEQLAHLTNVGWEASVCGQQHWLGFTTVGPVGF